MAPPQGQGVQVGPAPQSPQGRTGPPPYSEPPPALPSASTAHGIRLYPDIDSPVSHHTRSKVAEGSKVAPPNALKSSEDEEEKDEVLDSVLTAPMVEVAGPNGAPVLVHRPWTMKDIGCAYEQLPDPRETGGQKFAEEVRRFCLEFRPASQEMRRLLGRKLGADISKIRYNRLNENVQARQVQQDHDDNVPYNTFVTGLVDACQTAFPVRMDMTKIAMCKQRDGETMSQYLTRLTEIHNAHSGLTAPADMNAAEVTPYEAHLRNSFMNALHEDIAKIVRNTCIKWDTGKLNLIEQHAIHAEKLLVQEKAKRNKKREDQTQQAQLTMMQMVSQTSERGRGRGRARGRGRGRARGRGGRGRGRNDGCFTCGSKDHWARDCPTKEKKGPRDNVLSQVQAQVKEALPRPTEGKLHDLRPGEWVVIKDFRRKSWKARRWLGPFQVLLVTQTAVKVAERSTWVHASHCKRVPELQQAPDEAT
ncbi:uncharacterized protein LOC144492531 isoform X1 [Mustelus asterias]